MTLFQSGQDTSLDPAAAVSLEQTYQGIRASGLANYQLLTQAFFAVNQTGSQEELPGVLLQALLSVLDAHAGKIVDGSGNLVAGALPEDVGDGLPATASIAAWMPGDLHCTTASNDGVWVHMALALSQGQGGYLSLLFGSSPSPEMLGVLPLLAAHAQARDQYLQAVKQTEAAKLALKQAHEQQMEMALRLYDLYEEAQNQAITDGLTGLATHDFFQQRLAQEMRESVRYDRPLSLMLFDLDHFKSINDNHGHQAGDAVLKQTAELLKHSVRSSDLVARYGGEEFAVILPQTEESDAFNMADRLRQDLEAMRIAINDERSIKVTASIGLVSRSKQDLLGKDLVKRADVALYAAKNAGRNRVVVASGPAIEAIQNIGAPRQGSQEMFFALARAFAVATEARIPKMLGHSEQVGHYARLMGERLGFNQDKQESLYIAGLLHDVGMMGVSEAVILKQAPLDEREWHSMREHPAMGVGILARFSTFSGLLESVLYHHERFDGTGYPEGLIGKNIPIGARILALCDSYDAMVRGDYVHGEGVSSSEALAEVERCSGTQFDPELTSLFIDLIRGLDPAS